MSRSGEVWPVLDRSVEKGISLDIMGFAYTIMFSEWEKTEECEQSLYDMMEQNHLLQLPI